MYKDDLIKTLEFYANEDNYHQRGWQGDPQQSKISEDHGFRARLMLLAIKNSSVQNQG